MGVGVEWEWGKRRGHENGGREWGERDCEQKRMKKLGDTGRK